MQSFENAVIMEDRLNQDHAMKKFLAGVRFDNVTPNSTLPKHTMASIENKNGRYVLLLYTHTRHTRTIIIVYYIQSTPAETARPGRVKIFRRNAHREFSLVPGLGRNEHVNKPWTRTTDDEFQK